jgi:DHA1 family bicyclomycin/chloramphenicol resistance-like MFS transporter
MALPFIGANSTALAMSYSGRFAGSASSIIGVMQFVAAGIVSSLLGVFGHFSSFPMSLMITLCALVALILISIFNNTGLGKS